MEEKKNYQEMEGSVTAQEETSAESVQGEASTGISQGGVSAEAVQENTGTETSQGEASIETSQEEINEVDGEPIYHADEGEE